MGPVLITAVVVGAIALVIGLANFGASNTASVTTTITAGPPTYTEEQVAVAKKDACDANTTTGDALTQAQRGLAAISDRNSAEGLAALGNFQTVVLIETEYLKSKTRPEAPEAVRTAVHEYVTALLAEVDAETRMLPYGEINVRGQASVAASHKLTLACT